MNIRLGLLFSVILLWTLPVNAQDAEPVNEVEVDVMPPVDEPAPAEGVAPKKPKKVFTYKADIGLMTADYAQKGSDVNVRYLTIGSVPNKLLDKWASVIKYQVPSASRAYLIDRQVPRNIPGTRVFSINLASLQWGLEDWNKVLERYPYDYNDPKIPLLMIRGDWLVHELADTRDSRAYYLLLYGEKAIPKTDTEFLTFWGVDANQQLGQSFGWVEVKSQVSLQETRFIEHFNGRAQSIWRTKDMFKVTLKSDPLETLNGDFKHDGRELIAQVAKISLKKKLRGCSQVYMLANGDGKAVNEAPVRLVEDHKRTLGQTAIVNNASCVVCHEKGMNLPSSNGFINSVEAGDQIYAYSQGKQEEIEEFHATDSGSRLLRNNEDFARFIAACNNLKPEVNARNYKDMLDDYRANLDLERAAGELYILPETLRQSLIYASKNKLAIGSRLVGLTRGETIRRTVWEELYLDVKKIVAKYQTTVKAE